MIVTKGCRCIIGTLKSYSQHWQMITYEEVNITDELCLRPSGLSLALTAAGEALALAARQQGQVSHPDCSKGSTDCSKGSSQAESGWPWCHTQAGPAAARATGSPKIWAGK